MPVYFFTIHGDVRYPDASGTELKDDADAVAYGTTLVRELRQNFGQTESWSILVEQGSRAVQRIAFNSIV